MRNIKIHAHETRADGLLIGTDQADVGRSKSSGCYCIASRHALPGGGGHQAFAQKVLWTDARPVLIAPRRAFRRVRARAVSEAVAKQLAGRTFAELTAHGLCGLHPILPRGKRVCIGDGSQFDTG